VNTAWQTQHRVRAAGGEPNETGPGPLRGVRVVSAASSDEGESCPYREGTTGVKVITGTSPAVLAWSCGNCGTDWAVTVVHPHSRRRWLDQLTVEVTARAVLREVTALAGHADTLTEGQLRTRLLGCLARLTQVLPAGNRPDNGVPGVQPVPHPPVETDG
jgi:hypothetical protein